MVRVEVAPGVVDALLLASGVETCDNRALVGIGLRPNVRELRVHESVLCYINRLPTDSQEHGFSCSTSNRASHSFNRSLPTLDWSDSCLLTDVNVACLQDSRVSREVHCAFFVMTLSFCPVYSHFIQYFSQPLRFALSTPHLLPLGAKGKYDRLEDSLMQRYY